MAVNVSMLLLKLLITSSTHQIDCPVLSFPPPVSNLDSVVLNLHGLSVSLVLMAAALESMPGTSLLVIAALYKGTEDGKRREAAALFC